MILAFFLAPDQTLSGLWHFLLPIILLTFFRYLSVATLGSSPGLYLFQIHWVLKSSGTSPKRLFDWIFESELAPRQQVVEPPLIVQIAVPVFLLFFLTLNAYRTSQQDPSLFAFQEWKISVFAPEPKDPNWNVLAFFYATGTWPKTYQGHPVIYSLPYEKGPPERFVGKIQMFWELPGAKLSLLGPLTLKEPKDVETLKACFTRKWKCISLRREMMDRQLKGFFEKADLKKAAWFTVENEALPQGAQPQGLYFSGLGKNEKTWVEAYFLINSKMALQGIVLERTYDQKGIEASETLQKVVGSQRMVDDLLAPRTWVNAQISKIRLTEKSTTDEMIQAQAYLLSKVSVDPKNFESFYHLGGLSMTLFNRAKSTHEIELTSTSKQTILSTYQFGEDVNPKHPKLKELELFRAQLKKAP